MRQLPAQYIVFIGVMDTFLTALLYLVSRAAVILLVEKKRENTVLAHSDGKGTS